MYQPKFYKTIDKKRIAEEIRQNEGQRNPHEVVFTRDRVYSTFPFSACCRIASNSRIVSRILGVSSSLRNWLR